MERGSTNRMGATSTSSQAVKGETSFDGDLVHANLFFLRFRSILDEVVVVIEPGRRRTSRVCGAGRGV